MTVPIPPGFAALTRPDLSWTPWLQALPRLLRDVLADWRLTPDGTPAHGECAIVAPVLTGEGVPAALKLTWPHWEAQHEHVALQHWHGQGAVELLRADPRRWALLLERARPTDLTVVTDLEACRVVAAAYRRLHRPAPPQLRGLSGLVEAWTARLAALPRDAPLPRRLVEHASSLGRAFAADPATDGVMIHTDLHYANVLAAQREPWLVIDPKPVSGDPHYEPAPMLWNRWPEVVASGDVRRTVRRRLDTLVEAAALDRDRARDWVVVRQAHLALWTIEAALAEGRGLTTADRDAITRDVAIAKAVGD